MSDIRDTIRKLQALEGKYFPDQVRGTDKATKSKNGKHPFLGKLVGETEELDEGYEKVIQNLMDKLHIQGHFNNGTLILHSYDDINKLEDAVMGEINLKMPPVSVDAESAHTYGGNTWSYNTPAGESVEEAADDDSESWVDLKKRLRAADPDDTFDFDMPDEPEFQKGDKVVLKPDYAGNEAGEVFTVSQCDPYRRKCWIGDENNRGWYVHFNQIEPADEDASVGPSHERGALSRQVGEPSESISDRDDGLQEDAEHNINPNAWYVVRPGEKVDTIICGPHNTRAEAEKAKEGNRSLEAIQGRHIQMQQNAIGEAAGDGMYYIEVRATDIPELETWLESEGLSWDTMDELPNHMVRLGFNKRNWTSYNYASEYAVDESKTPDMVEEDIVRSMHRAWQDYLKEKEEEGRQFKSLEDAGPAYAPGPNEIWYWKQDLGRDFMMGYDWLEEHHQLPTEATLPETHVEIGTLQEPDLEKIYYLMQGEHWSPQGEARPFIKASGSGHTSMSVGDIVKNPKGLFMVDRFGFKKLPSAFVESIEVDEAGKKPNKQGDLLKNLLANSDVGFEGEDYYFEGDTVVANDVRTAGKILRAINNSGLFSKQAVVIKKGEQPVIGFDALEDAQTVFQDTIGPNDNEADVEVKTDTSGEYYLYINGKRSTRTFKNLAKAKRYIGALDHQLRTHSELGKADHDDEHEETEESLDEAKGKLKMNDIVRLLDYPENHINSHARVEKVTPTHAVVSNMNQPFSGTLGWKHIPLNKVKKVR